MARSCTVPVRGVRDVDASIMDDLLTHSGKVNKSTREAAYILPIVE